MNPQRSAKLAALCGAIVLAGWDIVGVAGLGLASIENAGAVPIENRRAASSIADAGFADAPAATAMGAAPVINTAADNAVIVDANVAIAAEPAAAANTDAVPDEPKSIVVAALPDSSQMLAPELPPAQVAPTTELVTATATDTHAAPDEPKPIVVAALSDPSQMLAPELPPAQAATTGTPDPSLDEIREAVGIVEIRDECLTDICIDRYLWSLYERTPKEDTIKVLERRKVTVKRKGKTITVTRSFTRLEDQDFTWKDPKAAERVGMPMIDYVIGGMDRSFRLKLYHTLRAAEQAGLSPGITSAFRDDYRQSIASGLKAATDRSFHGGSTRGGYGHGLAADVVSVNGGSRAQRWVSTDRFWKWIDAHGKDFGIGRPYLGRDPPHVAPIDGKEYVSRRGGAAVQVAEADTKKRNRLAMRHHGVAKVAGKRQIVRATSATRPAKQAAMSDHPTMAALSPQ